MNLSDIQSRHDHIEAQTQTQSVEILTERRTKAHKDRGWLISRLSEALEQNERLEAELVKLGEAVAAIQEEPAKAEVEGKAAEVRNGKAKVKA